jgi:Lipoprotein LpqB beta-propeller domain/Sporulation and spore germination
MAIFVIILSLLATAGCVSVPTAGPIERVEGQQPPCNCVNVQVKPPAPGAEPWAIVDGYLRATSNYQPNYSVAKQFLTKMAAEKWSPEGEVSIYQGSPAPTAASLKPEAEHVDVKLEGRLVGSLAKDRTYKPLDRALSVPFRVVKEKETGEWRIDDPRGGLWVDQFSFEFFYRPYELYFVGNNSSLVPDLIYLPLLSNPANVASALVKALLNGASIWLKPAVSTAIPPNTTLNVDSVTIINGIAEVPLSESVLELQDSQRSLLAAQIVYTLRQVPGVKAVQIKVNQQPYRVPGSDPTNLTISVDAVSPNMRPVQSVTGDQLYAVSRGLTGVRSGAVAQVTTTSEPPDVRPLPGPLGQGTHSAETLAVSVTSSDVAVTANGGTTLLRAPILSEEQTNTGKTNTTTNPSVLLSRVTELLRPQFSRYGEIWDIGTDGGRQWIWRFSADDKKIAPNKIELPGRGEKVTAFKISPDGTRMAVVRSSAAGSTLWLGRIIRSDTKIVVDGWRLLDTAQRSLQVKIGPISDIAWLNATELILLGAPARNNPYAPIKVVADASRITSQGEPQNWDAVGLTALPGTANAIIIGRAGQAWRYNGDQWMRFMDKVSTIAYPG